MDDTRYCPACGQPRPEGAAYCPKCGRPFVVPQALPTPPPFAVPVGLARVLIVLIIVGGVAFLALSLAQANPDTFAALAPAMPTAVPTAVPGLSCDQASDAVGQRHSTLFGLMNAQLPPFAITCGNRDATGNVQVFVTWYYKNASRLATFMVSPTGTVSPSDGNAIRIDEVAKYGPVAIKMLAGGL